MIRDGNLRHVKNSVIHLSHRYQLNSNLFSTYPKFLDPIFKLSPSVLDPNIPLIIFIIFMLFLRYTITHLFSQLKYQFYPHNLHK